MDHRAPGPPSRRHVLRLGALGGVAALTGVGGLTGCGVRLERDAPRLPLLPTADPHPAEAVLRGELATVRAAREAVDGFTPPADPTRTVVTRLRGLHADQERVLRARLHAVGATGLDGDPAPTPRPGGAAPAPMTSAGALAAVLATQGAGIDAQSRRAVADVPPSDRALVAALRAQRGVAWLLLGPVGPRVGVSVAVGTVPGPDSTSLLPPATWVPSPDLAVRLAAAGAAARYGAEVVAARAAGAAVVTARTGLAALADHAARLGDVARDAGHPPAPGLGYGLPFRVATAADVARLSRHVWTGWAQAVCAALVPTSQEHAEAATATADTQQPGPPTGERTGAPGAGQTGAPSGLGASPAPSATPADGATPAPSATPTDGATPAPSAIPADGAADASLATDASALVGWLLEAELMRQRWQAPPVPFPGLRWTP